MDNFLPFRNKTILYKGSRKIYHSAFDTMADPYEEYAVVVYFTNTNGTRAGPRNLYFVMSPPGGISLK